MSADFDWTDERIQVLRALWDSGISSGQIAQRMGTTKNAVVGKAHRLNLPPRPSPIRRGGDARAATSAPPSPRQRAQALQIIAPVKREALPPKTASAAVAHVMSKTSKCCWPIGDTKSPDFRYCDEPCVVSKSYCDPHHARSVMPSAGDGATLKRRLATFNPFGRFA